MKRKDYYIRVMKDSLIMAFLGFLIMAISAALAPNPGNITTLRMLVQELYISYAAGLLAFRIGFGITSISLLVGTIFTALYQWGKSNE